MKQKGFATIFGLCMVLVVALIVRGIQESETNHAREVLNFEMEQALQSAAESGIFEAAEKVRDPNPKFSLPINDGWPWTVSKKKIPVTNKIFHHGEKNLTITVEVWGERGKNYFYDSNKEKIVMFNLKNDRGNLVRNKYTNTPLEENYLFGVYLMSRATIDDGFFGEKIYRRAYAHFISKDQEKYDVYEEEYQGYEKVYSAKAKKLLDDPNCERKIYFMELPTQDGYIIKKKK